MTMKKIWLRVDPDTDELLKQLTKRMASITGVPASHGRASVVRAAIRSLAACYGINPAHKEK